MKLVYYEACCDKQDAFHREKYLKTAWGKRYLKTRMNRYLMGLGEASTTEIAKKRNALGFPENKKAAKDGGSVAGKARLDLEKQSGKRISTRENFTALPEAAKRVTRKKSSS